MNYYIQVLGNLIAPTLAGTIFMLFFLYFTLTDQARTRDRQSLVVYLFSFGIFLLGRPLQLLVGSPLTALVVNNARVFLFNTVCFPSILMISNTHGKKRYYYLTGLVFGIVHVVINTLGTRGTYLLLNMGTVQLRDLNTPSGQPPFYSREVTIGLSVLIGLIIAGTALFRIISVYRQNRTERKANRRDLYHISIFVFGCSFFIGAATKQWWIYYIFSVVSAFTLTWGVFMELKQIHYRMSQVIPLLKENILQNITFSNAIEGEISEMLEIIGVREPLNSFIVVKIFGENPFWEKNQLILFEYLEDILNWKKGRNRFLIIPISKNIVGICLALKQEEMESEMIHLAEELRESLKEKFDIPVNIGIGNKYTKLIGLRYSYRDAFEALNTADKLGKGLVIHLDEIQNPGKRSSEALDMSMEKEEIIQSIRTGNREAAREAMSSYLKKISSCPAVNLMILKGRLLELLGLMTDAGIALGADEEILREKSVGYYNSIEKMTNTSYLEKKMLSILDEIFMLFNSTVQTRSNRFVQTAKDYIRENYNKPLTVKDVADCINLSPSYFQHLFKSETDCSFIDYLTKIRIARAEELLIREDLPISDIAFSVGFDDSNYFSRVFKQKTGSSPREYRKERTPVVSKA